MSAITFQQYPSQVDLPDGRSIAKAKVLSSGGTVSIFAARRDWPEGTDTRTQAVVLVGSWEDAEVVPVEPGTHRIATGDGDVLVTAGGGCGCGDSLNAWIP